MSNAESYYRNCNGEDLRLFLDIDLKTQVIQDFRYKGPLALNFQSEFDLLKSRVLNKPYSEVYSITQSDLSDKKFIASMPLWLIHKAIDSYLGLEIKLQEQEDTICLCFGIGKNDLKKEILNRVDYNLQTIIAETFATSACGRCRNDMTQAVSDIRVAHGLIQGLTHSKSRLDKNGHWVKIKGMYPAKLLIELEGSKKKWLIREGMTNQLKIEITNIEGHHIWLKLTPGNDLDKNEKILMALNEYWQSEFQALFFLHVQL